MLCGLYPKINFHMLTSVMNATRMQGVTIGGTGTILNDNTCEMYFNDHQNEKNCATCFWQLFCDMNDFQTLNALAGIVNRDF